MSKNECPAVVVRRRAEMETEMGRLALDYALIREDASDGGPAYSVAVSCVRHGAADGIATVRDVTRDPGFAARVFDAVSRGGVTPCTLADVVSDLICE